MKQLSVMDFRVRLVREVAMIKAQANAIKQTAEYAKSDLQKIIQEREKNIVALKEECWDVLSRGELVSQAVNLSEKNLESALLFEKQKSDLEERIKIQEEEAHIKEKEAYDALVKIVEDILDGKYGRGRLSFSSDRLERVFGFDENEETHHMISIDLPKNHNWLVTMQDVQKILQICEENMYVPVIRMDPSWMPLSKQEINWLCAQYNNYQLLRKNISKDQFEWGEYRIFSLDEQFKRIHEIFAISLPEKELAIVKMDKTLQFPKAKLILYGKISQNEKYFDEVTKSKPMLGFKKFSKKEEKIVLTLLKKYLQAKHPGIVFV